MDELCTYCGAIGEVMEDNEGRCEILVCPKCRGSGLFKQKNVKSKLTMKEFFNKYMPESRLVDIARKCFKN